MRTTKLIFLLCVTLGMLSVSCRDTDNAKDLNSQEDGTPRINQTELEGEEYWEASDTTDVHDRRDKNTDSIYRENDVHMEHYEDMQEVRDQEQKQNQSGNQNQTGNHP